MWARPAGAPPLLQRLWASYLDALTRRPLLAKSATSLVCVIIGDSIAQALGGAPYSLARVARLAAFRCGGSWVGHWDGARCPPACLPAWGRSSPARLVPLCLSSTVGSAVGHYWHRWLEARVCPDDPRSARAVRVLAWRASRPACLGLCCCMDGWPCCCRRALCDASIDPVFYRHRAPPLTSHRQVSTKVAMDQLILSPVMTAGAAPWGSWAGGGRQCRWRAGVWRAGVGLASCSAQP